MVDGVLQQLGEDDGHGRGDLAGHHTGITFDGDRHGTERRGHALFHHPNQRSHDLGEPDLVVRTLGQRLVHYRDGADASHRLPEGLPGLFALQPPGLEAQQRRDGLQVVLHPVVDLADGGVLGHQLAVATSQLSHVTHQDNGPGRRASIQQGEAMADHRHLVGPFHLVDHRGATGECRPQHRRTQPGVVEPGAGDPPGHSHAMQGGDRVG